MEKNFEKGVKKEIERFLKEKQGKKVETAEGASREHGKKLGEEGDRIITYIAGRKGEKKAKKVIVSHKR